MNIFITAIGGDIGSAIARCIKEENENYRVIGCDITQFNQGLEFSDEYYVVPRYTETSYMNEIKRICNLEKVDLIIPVAEEEIKLFDYEREYFEGGKIKLAINNNNVLNTGLSKMNTALLINRLRLDALFTATENDIHNNCIVEYPVIVKNNTGCGSRNVKICYNELELQLAIKDRHDYVIQQYVEDEDEEYTVGVFSDGLRIMSVAFKRKLESNGGMTVFVETVKDKVIEEIAMKIATELKLVGCMNIQLRKDDDKYYVFEINPRISGTVGFRYKIGFKDLIWWINYLMFGTYDCSEYIEKHVIGVKKYDEYVRCVE